VNETLDDDVLLFEPQPVEEEGGEEEENKLLLWLLLMATTTTFLTFTLVTGPPLLELPVDRSDDRRDFLSISFFLFYFILFYLKFKRNESTPFWPG